MKHSVHCMQMWLTGLLPQPDAWPLMCVPASILMAEAVVTNYCIMDPVNKLIQSNIMPDPNGHRPQLQHSIHACQDKATTDPHLDPATT